MNGLNMILRIYKGIILQMIESYYDVYVEDNINVWFYIKHTNKRLSKNRKT